MPRQTFQVLNSHVLNIVLTVPLLDHPATTQLNQYYTLISFANQQYPKLRADKDPGADKPTLSNEDIEGLML